MYDRFCYGFLHRIDRLGRHFEFCRSGFLNRSSFLNGSDFRLSSRKFCSSLWLGFRLNDRRCRYRAYGICIFLWAALVALSRVMMAAHFFGDIFVGTLFGLAVGLFCAALARGVIRKWMEKPTA